MSKTVIVTVETTATPFPAGTAPAGLVITLVGAAVAPQHVTAAPYTASFSDVPAGTYTASAQAIDASNNPLGAPAVSAEFTIAADDVSVDIPTTVTVSVS
jgi:predicted phage tail protein